MKKKKINIHFSANLVDKKIVEFLSKEFEIIIVNITKEEIKNSILDVKSKLKTIDLIIFTGGEDVNPNYYHEQVGKFTHINNERDELEFEFLYNLKLCKIIENIPKLGICRGAQLLTIYNNGKLIQHVTGHNNDNQIIEYFIDRNVIKTIEITSDHHQMMFPYHLLENKYQLIGWSKNFQSNTYLNGENKEITLPSKFLEPEIIYYPYKNSLCIQSHPEWCIGSEGSDFCLELINQYLLEKKSEKLKNENLILEYNPFIVNPLTPNEILESVNNSKSITETLNEVQAHFTFLKPTVTYSNKFEKIENLSENKSENLFNISELFENEL